MKYIIYTFLIIIFFDYQNDEIDNYNSNIHAWWALDNLINKTPGVSWNKATTYLAKKPKQQIIVAVLDTDFDLEHKSLNKSVFWNNNEIPNNIDDDNNGFIDDLFGWNFLGIQNTDSALAYIPMEKTRILKSYSPNFVDSLYNDNVINFNYEDVASSYKKTVKGLEDQIQPYEILANDYTYVIDTLKEVFNVNKIKENTLKKFQTTDTLINSYIRYVQDLYSQGYPYDKFIKTYNFKKNSLEICMNLDLDSRELVGDDLENYNDSIYGNGTFGKNLNTLSHGTKITGIISSTIKSINSIPIKIDSPENKKKYPIQIMPITFTGVGDYLNKDLFMAIRYAVDNGAQIINLSQSKSFSINEDKIDEALRYAADHDVLVVMAAGNDNEDLDTRQFFPNDTDTSGKEIIDNLIIVGSSTRHHDKRLKATDSNYGKSNVDVFAPGKDIPTLLPGNLYSTESGTSYATPIVVNIAALIRSYYPDLSTAQVKKILMDSGTSYDVDIEIKNDEGDVVKTLPFSDLSKSGKIVNAYNALLMAEEVSRKGKQGAGHKKQDDRRSTKRREN